MLWKVLLSNGESREIESEEVDVGPAGELRFTYDVVDGMEYRVVTRFIAPGVWFEAEALPDDED